MVSNVRGRFTRLLADLAIAETFADTTLNATIDAASLTTGDEQCDAHITSADFLDVATFPHRSFALRELDTRDTTLTAIDREAFGITWNQALEAGGVLVDKTITIEIDAPFATNT